jgi:uncharacterized protein with PIN domain
LSERVPRLLVDGTAGRLARWLRILGLDVEYSPVGGRSAISRLATQSGRKVVTRNTALADRLRGGAILLASQDLEGQLRQVVEAVGAGVCKAFSRCSECNAALEAVSKESVRGRVPAYVFQTQDRFSVCPLCGRYYWHGTHWRNMLDRVARALEGTGNE